MSGEFAVIGLGQFGRAVATSLAREGQPVLAIDRDQALVEAIAGEVDAAVRLDATDEEALSELRLQRMTCVVVAIGSDAKEASILTTAQLRQLGVPRIIARASTELHARVLRTVGAHEVIDPEAEMGSLLALQLAYTGIAELIELGDAAIAEVEAPAALAGQSLADLDLRNRYRVSILAIRRAGSVNANPGSADRLASGDVLVLIGEPGAIKRLAALR